MRANPLALYTSSIAILTACAWPAKAQTAPAGSPDQAQTTPAVPPSPERDDAVQSAADEAGGEEIVVTGVRRSLQSAQNIKRNSDQIVDAVVAEDIGKLPDLAVSDTAARIPGVQVIRRGGEADAVLIRGLPDFATTYNGREIFTAETRTVALQDFPSANIAALEVFKTSTAELIEPGLAGLVNVRSRRPFDFQGLEIAGSVWGLYTRQAGEVTPNGNILVSNRWETGAGEIGILVNASYTELDFLDSEPSNTDFIADPIINGQRVRFPDIQRLFYRSGNRSRPSVNAAIQWRPNDTLELYVDGLYQGFRNKIDDRLAAVPLYVGGDPRPFTSTYSNLTFREGTNLLNSGTITGLYDPIFTFQGGTYNKTDTYQFAVGGIYDAGPLRVTADLARTDSTFRGSTESVDRIFANQATTAVDFDLTTPQFTVRNFDVANPANYLFDGLYEENQRSAGDDWQARLDATYELDGQFFLNSIQVGARYSTRDAIREFGNRFAGFRDRNIPASTLPLEFEVFRAGFRGTDVQSGFGNFLSPTYQSIRDNRVELRRFVIARAPNSGFTEAPPAAALQYRAEEDTLSGYAQLNYEINETIDGAVGLRAVRTKTRVAGPLPSGIPGGDEAQTYTDWLPNASIRFRVTPELQVRLSATQTRTRPTFAELNPSVALGPAPGIVNPADPFANARRGTSGNPFLEPFTSDNYDLSVEYYFNRSGFASAAVFRRDVDGFIQNQDLRFANTPVGPVIINAPVNSRGGRINGFEAQLTTFLDFDGVPQFLHNFGIQANYTYLDAKAEFLNPVTNEFELDRIVLANVPVDLGGVSKHSYNIVGLYEGGPFSGRLTYNKRSRYLDRRDPRGDEQGGLYREEAYPAGRLDLSLNYSVNENATVFFDWTNITGDPFRVNFSSARGTAPRAEYVRFLRYDETTLSLGARFRL